MINLSKNEKDKIIKIVDFYNKISKNPILEEEINKFIKEVINLSELVNEDISDVLDVCYDFTIGFFKISEICNLAKASILLRKSAEID